MCTQSILVRNFDHYGALQLVASSHDQSEQIGDVSGQVLTITKRFTKDQVLPKCFNIELLL